MKSRLMVMGGHEFDRLDGNESICDYVIELSGADRPRICILPTASGDPEDQIVRFRRSFGSRGCEVTDLSLFRLGSNPIDVRSHLMAQDVIYVGGGSLLNLVAIWKAHGIDQLMIECLESGVLICGQSAGAMCWFEYGITSSTGHPIPVPGLGLLDGSLCVHYHRDPERRKRYLSDVSAGLVGGRGTDDLSGLLYEDGELVEAMTFRRGAGIWRVEADDGEAVETPVEMVERIAPVPSQAQTASAVDDYRQLRNWHRGR